MVSGVAGWVGGRSMSISSSRTGGHRARPVLRPVPGERAARGATTGPRLRAVAVTLGLLVVAVAAYLLYRSSLLAGAALEDRALANAGRLIRLEDRLGLAWEGEAQRSWLAHGIAGRALATFYALAYWPLVAAGLIVPLYRARPVFRRLRNALMISGALGLGTILAMPTAPPRLLHGYQDEVALVGLGSIAHPSSLLNPYAAFPSFHVAWTLLAALGVASVLSSRSWRSVVWLVPVAMSVAVVTTGNHFVLDVVAGWMLAAAGWELGPAMQRQLDAHRERTNTRRSKRVEERDRVRLSP